MKKFFRFFETRKKHVLLLSLAWTLLIFIGCSMPGRDLPKMGLFDHFDKVVHFTFFMVFFIGWAMVLNRSAKNAILLILISMIYGFGLEYFQLYCVAGRGFDVWDGVADTAGAVGGWVVCRLLR